MSETPEPMMQELLDKAPMDYQAAIYHTAFHDAVRDFIKDDKKFRPEVERRLKEAVAEHQMVINALEAFSGIAKPVATPEVQGASETLCNYCGLPIRETYQGSVRNEWEHLNGLSFCGDGKHWAWPASSVDAKPPAPSDDEEVRPDWRGFISELEEIEKLQTREIAEVAWRAGYVSALKAAADDIEEESDAAIEEILKAVRGNILGLQIPPYAAPST